MGLLDSLTNSLEGALSQGGEGGVQNAIGNVLGQSGGLQGVLDQLHAGGLSDIVSSWTSGGAGQAISVDQLKGALNNEHLQQIASQFGVDPDKALALLAQHLPGLAAKAQG
jgi:uncharacterized protein YidB (DUF937 family)